MKTKWHFSAHPIGMCCLLAAGLFVPIAQLVSSLLSIIAHEAAHLAAIYHCGIKHCFIEWTPFGFVAQTVNGTAQSFKQRIWIASSGPIASLVLTCLCYPFAAENRFAYLIFAANLAILLINALPVLPLDGGRICLALAQGIGCERIGRRILLFLSYLFAAMLTILGIYATFVGVINPSFLILGPYLAYAAHQYSISSSTETAHILDERSRQRQGVFKVANWAIVGEADNLSLIKALRNTPLENYVVCHMIDTESGTVVSTETQHEMIVKLLGNKRK